MSSSYAEHHSSEKDDIESDCPLEKLLWDAETQLNALDKLVKERKTAYDNAMNEKKKWDIYVKQLRVTSGLHPKHIVNKRKRDDKDNSIEREVLISEI